MLTRPCENAIIDNSAPAIKVIKSLEERFEYIKNQKYYYLSYLGVKKDYRRLGYSDDWINQRLKAIDARKEFTDELRNKGIEKSNDFASLTNLLIK